MIDFRRCTNCQHIGEDHPSWNARRCIGHPVPCPCPGLEPQTPPSSLLPPPSQLTLPLGEP